MLYEKSVSRSLAYISHGVCAGVLLVDGVGQTAAEGVEMY